MIIIEKDVEKNVLTVKALSGGNIFTLVTYDLDKYTCVHNQLEDKLVFVFEKDNNRMATFNIDAFMEV